jgi:hypothetical protein
MMSSRRPAAAPNVGGTQWPTGPVNGQTLNYGMKTGVINVSPWKDEIKQRSAGHSHHQHRRR